MKSIEQQTEELEKLNYTLLTYCKKSILQYKNRLCEQ